MYRFKVRLFRANRHYEDSHLFVGIAEVPRRADVIHEESRDLQLGFPTCLMENMFLVLLGLLWRMWGAENRK
jgi:hypothetical protein